MGKSREKKATYRRLTELEISEFESRFCVSEAYSFCGRLSGKRVELSLLLWNESGKIFSEGEKVEKIREMFPKAEVMGRLGTLKIPFKNIEEFVKEDLYLLKSGVNKAYSMGLEGKNASECIRQEIIENKRQCLNAFYSPDQMPLH